MAKYILILNDGTDELFNLNGMILDLPEYFKPLYKEIFDTYDPSFKYYLEIPDRITFEFFMEISNKSNQTELEMGLLHFIESKFISYKVLRKQLKQWQIQLNAKS